MHEDHWPRGACRQLGDHMPRHFTMHCHAVFLGTESSDHSWSEYPRNEIVYSYNNAYHIFLENMTTWKVAILAKLRKKKAPKISLNHNRNINCERNNLRKWSQSKRNSVEAKTNGGNHRTQKRDQNFRKQWKKLIFSSLQLSVVKDHQKKKVRRSDDSKWTKKQQQGKLLAATTPMSC